MDLHVPAAGISDDMFVPVAIGSGRGLFFGLVGAVGGLLPTPVWTMAGSCSRSCAATRPNAARR